MDKCFGMAGWREFLQNRKEILNEVDKLTEQINRRPVKVAHGNAGEAFIRKWLSDFLPKKYGVTSGYIIPDYYSENDKLLHYDIIIYEALESPVLWVEGNYDDSEQGKYKAIPAKFVKAVYEVKATLTPSSAKDAVDKLKQLNSFKEKLAKDFHCGMFFIDLKKDQLFNKRILPELHKGIEVTSLYTSVVLRCEAYVDAAALIDYHLYDEQQENQEDNKNSHDLKMPLMCPLDEVKVLGQEDGSISLASAGASAVLVKTGEKEWSVTKAYSRLYSEGKYSTRLSWSHSTFSEFSIRMLGALEGAKYDEKQPFVFGRVFDTLETEKAIQQPNEPIENHPFFIAGLVKNKNSDNYLDVTESSEGVALTYTFDIKNIGEIEGEISNDEFRNSITVPPNKSAKKEESHLASFEDNSEDDLIELRQYGKEKNPLTITARFVYRICKENNNWEFYSIEARFNIYRDSYDVTVLS